MENIGQEILSLVDGARIRGDKYGDIVKQINDIIALFLIELNKKSASKFNK